jgi:3-methyladenine DNA glycosylase AlkD
VETSGGTSGLRFWQGSGKALKRLTAQEVLNQLHSLANPSALEWMARFGINPHQTLGISMPALRRLAREAGKDHALAAELWISGIHEARILAGLVDDPRQVTPQQMDEWVQDFDSWDVCDQVCGCLFDKTPYAYQKAIQWSADEREYVKRAGFVLMAELAVHDKAAADERFEEFFPLMVRQAGDERNFVRKAVNWALRGIGKRNRRLNRRAIEVSRQISGLDSRSAHWIAADALRELTSEKIQKKLKSD